MTLRKFASIVVFSALFSVFMSAPAFAQTESEDFVEELGTWFAEQEDLNPVWALHFLSFMREMGVWPVDIENRDSDLGRRFWNAFRRSQNYKSIEMTSQSNGSSGPPPYNTLLRDADLRMLDLRRITYWNRFDLSHVRFDGSRFEGTNMYACVLDDTSWDWCTMNSLCVVSASFRNAYLNPMPMWYGKTLSFYACSMQGTDFSPMKNSISHFEGGMQLRSCNLTDAIIPAQVYAGSSVRRCTGVVAADYEAGQQLTRETNVFVE